MIHRLERLSKDIADVHSKLILLCGPLPEASKSLRELAAPTEHILFLGRTLGARLAALPVKHRGLAAVRLLHELAAEHGSGDRLLIDNIELLFDRSLVLDPLDVLKQLARARRVIAVWPGELREGRLVYAEIGHPEHQDYSAVGVVPYEIH